jgi:hypothetical protein
VWIQGEIIIYSVTLEYSARSKSIDILLNSYIAMVLYCNLYGTLFFEIDESWFSQPTNYRIIDISLYFIPMRMVIQLE